MLDAGLQYAMERKAFGEPIANFQLIQAMLADSKAEIYAADCMLNDACARADSGEKILVEAAATKMFASEMCGRVDDRVVQIHGGRSEARRVGKEGVSTGRYWVVPVKYKKKKQ